VVKLISIHVSAHSAIGVARKNVDITMLFQNLVYNFKIYK